MFKNSVLFVSLSQLLIMNPGFGAIKQEPKRVRLAALTAASHKPLPQLDPWEEAELRDGEPEDLDEIVDDEEDVIEDLQDELEDLQESSPRHAPEHEQKLEKLEARLEALEKKAVVAASPAVSATSADRVPEDQKSALSERLVVVQDIIRRHNLAFDYRTHTVAELKEILAKLDAAKAKDRFKR